MVVFVKMLNTNKKSINSVKSRSAGTKKISLSLVIPVYNEQHRLQKTITALNCWRVPSDLKINQVIFVNDGSSDNTLSLVKSAKIKFAKKIISYSKNQGKGYAVRQGMLASKADYTLLMDADLATPLNQIKRFLPYFKNHTDVIIGTRKNGHSTVTKHQPLIREHLGRVYTKITNTLLQVPVTDFTCGFKAFSQKTINPIFSRAFINRWSYDSEILYLAHQLNFTLKEVAVTWADQIGTRVRLHKDIFDSLFELIKIKLNSIFDNYELKNIDFNQEPLKLLVISSYPEKDLTHGQTTVGVASYTKNTIDNLLKNDPNLNVKIWSENNHTWKRNSFFSLINLGFKLMQSNADRLLLPHEFNMFGGPKTVIFFPFYLLIAKFKNLPSTLILHQVVTDYTEIADHAHTPAWFIPFLNQISKAYFSMVISLSSNIVVFDQFLKDRLNFVSPHKITVIPHAVETFKATPKTKTNKTINLLYFGYLAQYKGLDWLIQSFKNYLVTNPNPNLKLIIAGGPNPNHLGKKHYREFLHYIYSTSRHPQIVRTGFVPQDQISKTYQNADMVVLPYQTAMSASGPLSISLSFGKPFIFSDKLTPYLQTEDFDSVLTKNKTDASLISFGLNQKDFNTLINKLIKEPKNLRQLAKVSRQLGQKRSWDCLTLSYLPLIRSGRTSTSNLVNLSYA